MVMYKIDRNGGGITGSRWSKKSYTRTDPLIQYTEKKCNLTRNQKNKIILFLSLNYNQKLTYWKLISGVKRKNSLKTKSHISITFRCEKWIRYNYRNLSISSVY